MTKHEKKMVVLIIAVFTVMMIIGTGNGKQVLENLKPDTTIGYQGHAGVTETIGNMMLESQYSN